MKEEIKEIIEEIRDSYYETQPSTKFYKNISLIEEEIERLCNKVDELMTLYTTERYVKEDYKSIIKEAREYINEHLEETEYGEVILTHTFDKHNLKELKDILGSDKE